MIKYEKTSRGFVVGTFNDRYNQECSIQNSSLATENCIWLGVDVDLNGNKVSHRMHLTQEMAVKLREVLTKFIDNGYINDE